MDEKKVVDFNQKLTYERLNNNRIYEADLKKAYREILTEMTNDYNEYRKHIPRLLSSLETNHSNSLPYSITLFFELYEELKKTKDFGKFDLSVMDYEADGETLEKMKPILEASYEINNQQRISEENFKLDSASKDDLRKMASLIVHKMQDDSKKLNWDKDLVETTLMHLVFLRQILVAIENTELFYHSVGLVFDRLTSSEFYQAGRDIAEEIILASYKDNVPELGYFNSFRIYSNIGSIHASLIYANLSMLSALKKGPPYSEKYVKEIIWQGIKFFRNVHLSYWTKQLYDQIPQELKFADYEQRSLDHSYFTSLLSTKDKQLPSLLLDYLNKEREKILSEGESEALPWLITLYNINRLYPDADFGPTGFGFFLNIFEIIVPAEKVKKYKDIIEANSEDLKKHLKESLVKLNETRNTTDFVYDNESALKISSRLIEYSSKKEDVSSFLLSMLIKSDYSLLFKSKEAKDLAPLMLPDADIFNLETLYDDTNAFLKALPLINEASINWLAFSEGNIFQLQLIADKFSFSQLNGWSQNDFKKLLKEDFFVNLSFSDTVKDKGQIRLVSPEGFKSEEDEVIKKLSFSKLTISDEAKSVLYIKDMQLSNFPHNLFLNQYNQLISKDIPVTNILSTEWFLQTKDAAFLPKTYSKSIWIPIESGDFALNYLYGNIEQAITDASFEVFQTVELPHPLSKDINIVCSHGAKNISDTQIVYQEDKATYDLDKVIGKGKILIFFVCHSGSLKTEFFRNNVASLVKRFIAQGYEAVIAPYWALDVTVPKYWLPEFLNRLDAGESVSQAMFSANRKVYDQFPTPAAWACLHLYGNPNLKIQED